MKTFLIVRGVDSQFKRTFVEGLMKILNPDVNHARAIRVSTGDHITDSYDVASVRAAETDRNHLISKILGGNHFEDYIVVDDESLLPEQWEILSELAANIFAPVELIGYDVISTVNFNMPDFEDKKNVQEENCAMFIAAMAKYHCIKTDKEKDQELLTLRNTLNELGE